ncbi:MAG: hypothetical protein HY306_03655 [Nitrosomonadales bacterium]|nr:hypothetical protein [Nitrosomonadales bacterium]
MKKIITAVALLVALMPMMANASFLGVKFGKDEWEKEDCPKNHSLAWCLADYQGRSVGMRDMSQEDFLKVLKDSGVSGNKLESFIQVGGNMTAAGTAFALGDIFGGGVFLLNALMPSRSEQNQSVSYVVFFDKPKGLSEQRIADDFNMVIIKAIKDSLPAMPSNASVSEKIVNVAGKNIMFFRTIKNGSDCNDISKCSLSAINSAFYISAEPRSVPEYMGKEKVISPKIGVSMGVVFSPEEGLNRMAMAAAISSQLPPWVYWFIPTGYLGNNPVPMFLNQGKPMFFVKPAPNDPMYALPHVKVNKDAAVLSPVSAAN